MPRRQLPGIIAGFGRDETERAHEAAALLQAAGIASVVDADRSVDSDWDVTLWVFPPDVVRAVDILTGSPFAAYLIPL